VRGIPRSGQGFGILKYLSEDGEIRGEMSGIPGGEISFNYLGQFDRVIGSGGVIAGADESAGEAQSGENEQTHLLTINGLVRGGSLEVIWGYSERRYREETIERLAESYMRCLGEIVEHCRKPGSRGLTPSDFPLAGLSEEKLGRLSSLLDRLNESKKDWSRR
jgi:non-ribosomal peptide synthase protein (TIGR01720 family)